MKDLDKVYDLELISIDECIVKVRNRLLQIYRKTIVCVIVKIFGKQIG